MMHGNARRVEAKPSEVRRWVNAPKIRAEIVPDMEVVIRIAGEGGPVIARTGLMISAIDADAIDGSVLPQCFVLDFVPAMESTPPKSGEWWDEVCGWWNYVITTLRRVAGN